MIKVEFTLIQRTNELYMLFPNQGADVWPAITPVQWAVNGEAVTEEVYNIAYRAMVEARATRCRTCGAPIIWRVVAPTADGKPHPINPAPDPAGNILLVGGGQYRVLTRAELEAGPRPAGQLRYISHFVTCGHAKEWRRPK